jgi:predicted amino acid-binding ACT domain protein
MALEESNFTALILLSAADQEGLEEALLKVLEPFSLTIEEQQKIALRGRLILGILISCDPAHVLAIDEDLLQFGTAHGVDVAIDFSEADSH